VVINGSQTIYSLQTKNRLAADKKAPARELTLFRAGASLHFLAFSAYQRLLYFGPVDKQKPVIHD
jgi:hypothetical protein